MHRAGGLAPYARPLTFLAAYTTLVLVDPDMTAASRRLVESFIGTGYFEHVGTAEDVGGTDGWLEAGRAQTALVIGEGYGEAAARGSSPAIQLIVGKLFPFAMIGLLDLHLVTALAVWYFKAPLRGSFPLLVGMTLLFLLSTLGLGLLVSTNVRTQQQAMLSSSFFLMVPMIYLSGLIFPVENMPMSIQDVTYAIPLKYYETTIRGIFLKGSGLDVLWPEALAMTLMGLFVTTLAARSGRAELLLLQVWRSRHRVGKANSYVSPAVLGCVVTRHLAPAARWPRRTPRRLRPACYNGQPERQASPGR